MVRLVEIPNFLKESLKANWNFQRGVFVCVCVCVCVCVWGVWAFLEEDN